MNNALTIYYEPFKDQYLYAFHDKKSTFEY